MPQPHARKKDTGDPFDNTILSTNYGEMDVGQIRALSAFHMHPALAEMLLEKFDGQHMMTFHRRGDRGGQDDPIPFPVEEVADDARQIDFYNYADGFVLIKEEIDPSREYVEQTLPPDRTFEDVTGKYLYRWTDIAQTPAVFVRMMQAPGNWVLTHIHDDLESWLGETIEFIENRGEVDHALANVEYQKGASAPTLADLARDGIEPHLEDGPIELCRWQTIRGEQLRLTVELTEGGYPSVFIHSRYNDGAQWTILGAMPDGIGELTRTVGHTED